MPITTKQTNTSDDDKQEAFAPIRKDLLERLTRECESKTDAPWTPPALAGLHAAFRKLRQR